MVGLKPSTFAALAVACAPVFVHAQTLIDATDPGTIAEIARGYGAVEVTRDSEGDPMLRGRMEGRQYLVVFYGCDRGLNCTNIQLRAAWVNTGSVTPQTITDWNRENRFGKAFLDSENDPVVQWDVNLFGGVSRANLDDTFDWWRLVMEGFEAYIE